MNGHPNVLLPDVEPPYRQMCELCHRTLIHNAGKMFCPECGFSVEVEETQPESRLVADEVTSFLVQPQAKVQETDDIPAGYALVKEEDLSPPIPRRRTFTLAGGTGMIIN